MAKVVLWKLITSSSVFYFKTTMHTFMFYCFYFPLTFSFLWNFDLVNLSHPFTFILPTWKSRGSKNQNKHYIMHSKWVKSCLLSLTRKGPAGRWGSMLSSTVHFSVFAISISKSSRCGSWFSQEDLCWEVMIL